MRRGWRLEYSVLGNVALRLGTVMAAVGFILSIMAAISGNVAQGATAAVLMIALLVVFERVADLKPSGLEAPTPETHVRCPDCAELIRRKARFCSHCGCKLTPQ
jgi:hypothetical protein